MRRGIPMMALAIGVVWTVGVSAQGRNFGGSWTIDSERTAAANPAPTAAVGEAQMRGGGGGGRGGGGVAVAAGGGAVGAVGAGGGARSGGGGEVTAMAAGGGGARGGRGAAGPTTIAIDTTTFTVGTTAYKLDGSTTTIQTNGGDVTAKAAWKGDQLVIEQSRPGPNGLLVTTTTYYLEGEALVRETKSPTPDGTTMTRKTYFKKS